MIIHFEMFGMQILIFLNNHSEIILLSLKVIRPKNWMG